MDWSRARSAWWSSLVIAAIVAAPELGVAGDDDPSLPVLMSFDDAFSESSSVETAPSMVLASAPDKPMEAPNPPQKGGVSHTSCCWGGPVDWTKVPAWLCPMPRTGFFANPPTGPGYFSAVDWLHGDYKEKRPPSGYLPFSIMGPGFFDADFRYIESKPVEERTISERLKRIYLTDCVMFSTGGQAWVRIHDEHNSRLTDIDNDFALPRVRVFGDMWFGDTARVYGEYIWADSINAELPIFVIDENRGDILNLFLDVNVVEWDGAPVVARVGRQELLLGSQRLVSTLDWANTRRTFEGVRTFRRGEKWDLDAFFVQWVPPRSGEFDQPDSNQDFAGAWATYRREKGEALDFYYLYLNDSNELARQGVVEAPFEASTVGSRWSGDQETLLWDFEGAVQFGNQGNADQRALMGTASVGKHMKDWKGNPTGWLCYDYASGDADPGVGDATTFHQLYPFGHYYLGWADLVGRRNIHDANTELYFYPNDWTTVWLQYHHFWLAEARDALYNAAGAPYRRDPTGQAGTDVGNELDVIVNFHVTTNSDILFAYCKLWGGEFLQETSGPNRASYADLMYFMYQVKW
jgi:hypothetical protein